MIGLELMNVLREPMRILNPLAFLLLAITLFSLAIPQDVLREHGAAVLWVLVLLTTILSLDDLFRRRFDNGVLEQLFLTAPVPFLAIAVRLLIHWLYSGFIISLMSPLLGLLLGMPKEHLPVLMLSLFLGTPALTLLGGMGAALTVGFSRGGVVLALLVLPLFVPILIFGMGAISEHSIGASATAQLYWLGFISMAALTVGPFATLAGLKISIQLQ